MLTLEASVLSAWYCSRPEIRRLRAIRDADGLRVLVALEPAHDSSEAETAWLANRLAWTGELAWHTGDTVRLENADDPLAGGFEPGGIIVADLSWRDPSSTSI